MEFDLGGFPGGIPEPVCAEIHSEPLVELAQEVLVQHICRMNPALRALIGWESELGLEEHLGSSIPGVFFFILSEISPCCRLFAVVQVIGQNSGSFAFMIFPWPFDERKNLRSPMDAVDVGNAGT